MIALVNRLRLLEKQMAVLGEPREPKTDMRMEAR